MRLTFVHTGVTLRRELTFFHRAHKCGRSKSNSEDESESASARRTTVTSQETRDKEGGFALQRIAANVTVAPAPHSGSHFVRRRRGPEGGDAYSFFEGWYVRCILPDLSASFAFMFSVEASGVATIQVAGCDDEVHFHQLADITGFRASTKSLRMQHWDGDGCGYELSSGGCCGVISGGISWMIRYSALNSWGDRDSAYSRCTATRLSRLRAFEPGWQVLVAHGVGLNGVINYGGKSYALDGCRIYIEKNWGRSFPSKWWWLQANAFPSIPDLSITAVGATRTVINWEETVGMIAIHYRGTLYEFANWNSDVNWEVKWGEWSAEAKSCSGYLARVCARTEENGVWVRGPTKNGMIPNVRDAMNGRLTVSLSDPDGNFLLKQVVCSTAQVEIGGDVGDVGDVGDWKANVRRMGKAMRGFVNLIDAPCAKTTTT